MSLKTVAPREQVPVVIPNLTMKELFDAIPSHCFERSALRSSVYVVWDLFVVACIYKATTFAETFIPSLPSVWQSFASFSLWSIYGFWVGLFGMGIWVIAHECGHQAFSESKALNNAVGWVLHSALGVPYHSWRISHAKHHASTCHMTQDQVFVPASRKEMGLPDFKPAKEDLSGANVAQEVRQELWEALGDSPIATSIQCVIYLLAGLPMYLVYNTAGQPRFPKGTNHFSPSSVVFSPHQRGQIILSDFGIFIWLGTIILWAYYRGFAEMFRVYLVPYLWVNHWLVLITFLQHTDPLVPHYRADVFTFQRGALSTLDRSLLGDLGSVMGWIAAHATNGISETHVLHHVTSKIPHYHAWEASDALRKLLHKHGITRQGAPGGWAEVYRVMKACRFVEDEGSIVFYKNSYGEAAARPVFRDGGDPGSDDSGVELNK